MIDQNRVVPGNVWKDVKAETGFVQGADLG